MIKKTDDPAKDRARLMAIIRTRSFGRGKVKLVSGRESTFYFDMKPTMLDAEGATLIARLVLSEIADLRADYVGGLEMGAVPIAGAIAQASFLVGQPIAAFFVRKQAKAHGSQRLIEGPIKGETLAGKRVVIVEDVTTTGGSALKAAEAIVADGATIACVLTLVDRQEGASEAFAAAGLPFRAIFRAEEFLAE
jgi:orotate phosphoribosyltransferase